MTIPALPQTSASLPLTKERIDQALTTPSPVRSEMKDMLAKLNNIEEKSKCLRVQFLDWLSDKLLNWSNRCHEMSVRIDSPCVIKVEPRKKEDSKHYKESKEIARLKEMLETAYKRSDEANTRLYEMQNIKLAEIEQIMKKVSK